MNFDYIVIGAGFAGATLAERIANVLDKKVLVIEKRQHIGGNAYDTTDKHGILVHKYGPHIFHTRIQQVWDYLSNFTEWIPYFHRVLGAIDGKLIPIPFNLDSLYKVFPTVMAQRLETKLVNTYAYGDKIPILKLRQETDGDLNQLSDFIYNKIFLNYTLKQWGVKPEDIDSSVTSRVPVIISNDGRYFQDKYQAMPKYGYTKMFERMLFHPNIHIMLNSDFKEFVDVNSETGSISLFGAPFNGKLIYTGPIDYFYDYKFGPLPYRSLKFAFEHHQTEFYQPTGTVNYPNEHDFTRITEFKYLTSQSSPTTTIVKEYPQAYDPKINIPYYPIKTDANHRLYRQYLEESKRHANMLFVGRLAEYQYYDMDAVVSKALRVFNDQLCCC